MQEGASFILPGLLRRALQGLLTLILVGIALPCLAKTVVIGDESLGAIDATIVGRVYTGRTVQVAGVAVQPVNMKAGDPRRLAFLRAILQQSDDDYVAYWIVRRAIGKGTPPPEVDNLQALFDYVRSTPGAIGYAEEADLVPGVKVLLILP